MLRCRVTTAKTTKSVIFNNIVHMSKQNSKIIQLTLGKQFKKTEQKETQD